MLHYVQSATGPQSNVGSWLQSRWLPTGILHVMLQYVHCNKLSRANQDQENRA
jgi:hypothetical protein